MDRRTVRSSCMDFLGRPPDAIELERWAGKTRTALATALFGSVEFWAHWVREQLFYLMLIDNFRPAEEAIAELPEELATHVTTPRAALHRLALTSSFDLRNPGADTFVTVVIEQFLGWTVQKHKGELEAGKAAYDGREARFLGERARSQSDVVRVAIQDRAATEHLLAREYQRLLHGDAPDRELRDWVREVHRDPLRFIEVVRQWFLSEEYDERLERGVAKSNRLYVRALFADLVGALPPESELEALRSALDGLADPLPLRSVLARSLIESGRVPLPTDEELADAPAWVAAQFERLLGREATSEELEVFLEALGGDGCSPATVLYALVSSDEYQRF